MTMHIPHRLILPLTVLWAMPSPSSAQELATGLELVALPGQLAPETEPGTEISNIAPTVSIFTSRPLPRLDEAGHVVFIAELEGPQVIPPTQAGSNALAVYAHGPSGTRLVARLGDPVPGMPSATITGFPSELFVTPPQIAGGQAVFHAGSTGEGFFTEVAGGLARLDTDPPYLGVPPGLQLPTLPLGAAIFEADPGARALVRMSNGLGVGIERSYLMRAEVGAPATMLLGDDFPAPFVSEPGITIGKIPSGCASSSGIAAFTTHPSHANALVLANLKGSGIDCQNDQILYRLIDDQLEFFLREGDPAPVSALGPGVAFVSGSGGTFAGGALQFFINATNHVAFAAVLMGGPAETRGESIWTDRNGQLELVVLMDDVCTTGGQRGFLVPGQPANWSFSTLLGLNFNDAGQVAFLAFIGDHTLPAFPACLGRRRGIFWDGTGSLSTVALIGEQVPGLPAGVNWGAFPTTPRLTAADHLFFEARLAGSGISPANNDGIFVVDIAGNTRVLLRDGQLVDIFGNGSDVRQVAGFTLGTGDSQSGEIPVLIRFTDGSEGLFVLRIHQGIPYGCEINVRGSLSLLDGNPAVGESFDLGVDNPLGTQAPGATSFLMLSLLPDPAFPCGTVLPGFGMQSASAPGELLISPLVPPLVGPPWQGPAQPAPFSIAIPARPTLVGIDVFVQGALFDPTGRGGVGLGLTNALKLRIVL